MAAQRYRIFIAGHSYRHVFGTDTPSEVRKWLVTLYEGKGDFPPISDWSVEEKLPDGTWGFLNARDRQRLHKAINDALGPDYNKMHASQVYARRHPR